MKWFILLLALLILTGCASTRAKFWAWGSDKFDEMDGTDDVSSVIFGEQPEPCVVKVEKRK